jgi:polysaccharide biosynthesis protein PslG
MENLMRIPQLLGIGRILLFAAVAFALAGPLSASPAQAQGDDVRFPRYFPETGFWTQGPFREYWETHGGLYIFGYPITGVFWDDGLYKQYFERAIFEYHPEYSGTPYEVLLQRLGSIRTEHRIDEEPFQPLLAANDENCNYHPETGHRLCHGFRTFWNDNGGLPNFGYPISEEFDERNDPPPSGDGEVHTVQYYERARFEYHPENLGTRYETLLGLLGTEYLVRHGAPAEATARQPSDMPPPDPITGRQYGPHVGFGFNIAWQGDESAHQFHQQTFDKVNEAGFSWVRIQIAWRDVEPNPGQYQWGHIDRIVDLARANNVRIMASVLKAPHWATGNGTDGIPADTGPYQALMEQMAARYAGRIHAYEIWNEQNLAHETGGYVDIGRYVNILRAGYAGVKAGHHDAIVVFGGLTPTGVDDPYLAIDDVVYLQRIYDYNGGEVRNYYDVLGVHPGSNNNSPDQWWPGNPGQNEWSNHNSFYFRRAQEIRNVMVQHGEAHKQIWLTEFGWTTYNPVAGYEYGAENSEAAQAQYLVRAFEIARAEWPWMGVMFVWNLNFAVVTDHGDEKHAWGVLRSDWSNRPAFDGLKNIPK